MEVLIKSQRPRYCVVVVLWAAMWRSRSAVVIWSGEGRIGVRDTFELGAGSGGGEGRMRY